MMMYSNVSSSSSRLLRVIGLCQLLAAMLLSSGTITVAGLQLSMVGSAMIGGGSSNNNNNKGTTSTRTSIAAVRPPSISTITTDRPAFDLSSGLISQLAVVAIRTRLRAHTSVSCEVTPRPAADGFFSGSFCVGPATVKGRGWQSGLGLTCRAIEATVDVCELDKGRVVSDRKLVLKQPAKGTAMIALDKTDFGNFLAHPFIRPSSSTSNNSLQFLRDGVSIDPAARTVNFFALVNGRRWNCSLRRGTANENTAAVVNVTPIITNNDVDVEQHPHQYEVIDEDLSEKLSQEMTKYFNDIVFELDGTFLTFGDMMITTKGASPSVLLKMGIRVEKFPSRNLAF